MTKKICTLGGLWQVAVATKHVTGLSKYRLTSRRCALRRPATQERPQKKEKQTFVKISKLCRLLMKPPSLSSDDKRDDLRCTFLFTPRENIMKQTKSSELSSG